MSAQSALSPAIASDDYLGIRAISIIPASNEDLASSRIRSYTLQKGLNGLGIRAVLGDKGGTDVLFVQKRWDWTTLSLARRARFQGRTVVFDVDDAVETDNPNFLQMIALADIVTTATPGLCEWLRQRYAPRRLEVMPNAADYYPEAPMGELHKPSSPLRVLWFGNSGNLRLIEKYLPVLSAMVDVQPVVSTDGAAGEALNSRYPGVLFVPWTRRSFLDVLRSCHLTCLMHDGSEKDNLRSNHKMATSIVWGVPAVVSRTPEYERTAKKAGINYALFEGPEELRTAIDALRTPAARERYLQQAQPEIWKRHCPQAMAEAFLGLLAGSSRRVEGEQGGGAGSWALASSLRAGWRFSRDVAKWLGWKSRAICGEFRIWENKGR